MKTIGLLGGMSWESTTTYYQHINRHVRNVKGGVHSAKCIIFSFDFAEIEQLQRSGQWSEAASRLEEAATKLKLAGADGIVICANTMHFVSAGIEKASGLPLLHIADPTAERIVAAGYRSVGLLGTRFTMEKDFYKSRLAEKYALDVIVPNLDDQAVIHNIIYRELVNGVVKAESRKAYQAVIKRLADAGAECVILGCTEIIMLIDSASSELPVFDTTENHAIAAAEWAMADEACGVRP